MAEKSAKIGKYIVEDILGKGGMGIVYKAFDPILSRTVAIKMIVSAGADDELRARFYREAQSLGTLQHKNIITIYDLGQEGDNPYFAMEFLTGTDLDKMIKARTQLELTQKVDIIRQVCDGLDCAHKAGITHRDIKPANIRVLDDGTVKIMDFGIARVSSSATMTRSGLIMGTVHYMSPEQIKGHKVDGRSDIFSVGAVLFELLTYVKPFHAETMTSVLFKIVNDQAPSLESLGVSPPPALEQILKKALAKDLGERYSEIGKMAKDLRELNDILKADRERQQIAGAIDNLLAEGEQRFVERTDHGTPEEVRELLATARELYRNQFYEDALRSFKEILELDPGNVEALSLAEACEAHQEEERRKVQVVLETKRHEIERAVEFVEFQDGRVSEQTEPTTPAVPVAAPPAIEEKTAPDLPVVAAATAAAVAPEPARRSAGLPVAVKIAAAAVALGAIITIAVVLLRTPPSPPPPPVMGVLILNPLPWAEIERVADASTQNALDELKGRPTPCRIELPEGRYVVTLQNGAIGLRGEYTVEIKAAAPATIQGPLPGFDPVKAAEKLID